MTIATDAATATTMAAMASRSAAPNLDRSAIAGQNERELRAAAQEFEAHFLAQMMAPMFEGLSTDPPFGGGHSEEIYRSMLIDEYGREFARQGGLGLAEPIVAQLLRLQEAT